MQAAPQISFAVTLGLKELRTAGRFGDIKSLLFEELQRELQELNEPAYRAGQIIDWLYKKRAVAFEEMTDLPQPLRARLVERFSIGKIDIIRVLGSRDTTRKFLFRLSDGNLIESVLIPASPASRDCGRAKSDRRTVCVSTQVGCAYGCKFCASGLEGFSRNLGANEIVDQIITIERSSEEKIDNLVFMGMGEPLANFDNVMRAIRIINAPWGLGIGARHITVSTSGLAPQIKKLAHEPLQIRLAISLHGATDQVRNQIMPINRRYNIETLLSACDFYVARRKQRLTLEYILIADVNDSDDQAHLLAAHTRRLGAKVNLIPYNTVEGLPWSRPSRNRQEKFLSILRGHGISATLRREKGGDIDAACGQLRLQTKKVAQASGLPVQ
ncbi:MAG: 23S rRNA (adenine(2503)-C(2))-methyltransferase RlmN [Verrucomicrobia bacterium]|nr:MAG: 23S rRNA (adenine(2503)-C(2))-methyltransferase RlmN [Verrucomicrobiota bacterium]